MADFNKKKKYKRFIYSPITFLFLFIILLLLLKAMWGVYQKEKISARYLKREQTELAKLTARQKELANSVEYLKTDKGIEAEIRSKFRLSKEGESIAVIIDNDASTTTVAPTSAKTSEKGLFGRIWGWLKNW